MKTQLLLMLSLLLVLGTSTAFKTQAQTPSTGVLFNTISGVVWNDENDDQIMYTDIPSTGFPFKNENPIPGILVKLVDAATGDITYSSAITDMTGTYTLKNFYGVGDYKIVFFFPEDGFDYPEGNTVTGYPLTITSSADITQDIGIVRKTNFIYFGGMLDPQITNWVRDITLSQYPYYTQSLTDPNYEMIGNPQVWVSESAHNPSIDLINNAGTPGVFSLQIGGVIKNPTPGIPGSTGGIFQLNSVYDINNLSLNGHQSINWKDFFSGASDFRNITNAPGKALYDGSGGSTIDIPFDAQGLSIIIGNGNLSATFESDVSVGAIVLYQVNELPVILPITLKSFEAEVNNSGNAIDLTWTTASERENTGFDIERSTDGKNYTSIDFVSTKAENGESHQLLDYKYQDNEANPGINYYRLKQIDQDGQSVYSFIRTAELSSLAKVEVYPNPASNSININAPINSKVSIYDVMGRMVLESTISKEGSQSLDISSLPKGNYSIQISHKEHIAIKKITINN